MDTDFFILPPLAGLVMAGIIIAVIRSYHKQFVREDEERRQLAEERAEELAKATEARLGELLEAFEAQPAAVLEQLAEGVEDLDSIYRPKRGEEVLAVFEARMAQMTTETKAAAYGGLGLSLKVWGPLRLRAGQVRIGRVTRNILKEQGPGLLVVTNKKLLFNAHSHGKDWSRTWNTITTWGVYADAVQVEQGNGKPLVFLLDSANPLTHPGFVSAVFEYAHNS